MLFVFFTKTANFGKETILFRKTERNGTPFSQRTNMFKNSASSMVLNKKYTMLLCSPKLTFEINHRLV